MRILEIIGSVDPRDGGAIEGLLRQSQARLTRGVETLIASLDHPDAPWVRECPIPAVGLGEAPSAPGTLWRRYGYTPRLVPWLRRHVPEHDVVVVNGLWNYVALASRRALPSIGKPYAVFPHGMLDPWFRAGRSLKHAAKQASWLIAEGPLLASADAVLFTTAAEMARAENAFWPYHVRGRVVGYGTADIAGDPGAQVAAFYRRIPAVAGKPFFLFLGRLHRKKGCDILAKAFAKIAAANPCYHLVIAGPDPDNLRAEIEPLLRAAHVQDRVHWPDMISGDVKWGALRACKALVLPSHQENFGVVVAEAMAAGRPVLISDQVNICREVKAAGAGLVATDDVDGTTRMLRIFLSLSAEAVEQMGRAARACFLDKFEATAASETICSALMGIISENQARRSKV